MKHTAEITRLFGNLWIKVSHHTDTRGTDIAHLSEAQALELARQLNECVANLTGVETVSILPDDVQIGDVLPYGEVYIAPYLLGEEVTLYLRSRDTGRERFTRVTFDHLVTINIVRKIS